MMENKEGESGLRITDDAVVFDSMKYPLSQLSSVRVLSEPNLSLYIYLLLFITSASMVIGSAARTSLSAIMENALLLIALVSIIVWLVLVLLVKKRHKYTLRLYGSFGKADITSSFSKSELEAIEDLINKAIKNQHGMDGQRSPLC